MLPVLGKGGAERQFLNYTSYGDSVHEHCVFSWNKGPYDEILLKNGIKVFLVKNKNPLSIIIHYLKTLHEIKPDIIQSWLPQTDVFCGLLNFLGKHKVIASERSSEKLYISIDGVREKWYTKLRPFVLKHFITGLITNSPSGLEYIQKITNNNLKVKMIENGIIENNPITLKDPFFNKLEMNFTIITVSRLVKYKRIDLIISAIRTLIDMKKSVKLIIVGSGSYENNLKNFAQNIGLTESVIFYGYSDNVPSLLLGADVFCTASEIEGLPNALLEAMSLGIPVLASNIDSHNYVMEDAAIYFNLGDKNDLVEKILLLINDKELRERLKYISKKRLEKFSLSNMVKKFDNFYEDILLSYENS